MRKLRIAFSDFPGPFNPSRIAALLSKRYELVINDHRPDFVIFSIFGHDFMKYGDAVRIFFVGENVRPDFNLCDYAFSYDWLEFGDRHYRCPNYQLYEHFKIICRDRKTSIDLPARQPRKFCNFIYSNANGHPLRDQFFHILSKYKKIDSVGAHLNNMGVRLGTAYTGDWPTEKVEFQSDYKFSMAFENSSTPGYTTEKIVHALAAGTIPIYWGNPLVHREFNTQRFINLHDYPTVDAVIERIGDIDRDDALYHSILEQPFFPDDRVPDALSDDAVLDVFDRIFAQDKALAFRRNFHFWGDIYEQRRRSEVEAARRLHDLDRRAAAGPLKSGLRALRRLASPLVRRLRS